MKDGYVIATLRWRASQSLAVDGYRKTATS